MSEKDFIALEYAVCPVCGKEHNNNCGILMDTRLRNTLDKKVVTHFELCEEHEKHKEEGYVFLVEIDEEKSKITKDRTASLEGVYRTGKYASIKKEIALELLGNDTEIMFVDKGIMDYLKELQKNSIN